MHLNDALDQIADIRLQMSQTRIFRGFRSATTLMSACIAVAASVAQAIWIPNPARDVDQYMELWFGAGLFCLAIVAVGMTIRYRRSDSPLERELALSVVQQFIPCLVIGGLVTFVLAAVAWQSLWLAPALWTIFFGMGILSCRQLLPAGTLLVGLFYLMCGLVSIAWAKTHGPFSPLAMGVPFGVGQAMAAGILYWKLERNHAPE
jgi:hypothetical protein